MFIQNLMKLDNQSFIYFIIIQIQLFIYSSCGSLCIEYSFYDCQPQSSQYFYFAYNNSFRKKTLLPPVHLLLFFMSKLFKIFFNYWRTKSACSVHTSESKIVFYLYPNMKCTHCLFPYFVINFMYLVILIGMSRYG